MTDINVNGCGARLHFGASANAAGRPNWMAKHGALFPLNAPEMIITKNYCFFYPALIGLRCGLGLIRFRYKKTHMFRVRKMSR